MGWGEARVRRKGGGKEDGRREAEGRKNNKNATTNEHCTGSSRYSNWDGGRRKRRLWSSSSNHSGHGDRFKSVVDRDMANSMDAENQDKEATVDCVR